MSREMVEFDDIPEVDVVSEQAILVVVGGDNVWIPRSQISKESEVQDIGDSGTLIITEWIAQAKGLI